MVEKTSARPEFVFTKTLWNSLGAVEAMEQFPCGIAEIEEGIALLRDEEALIVADLELRERGSCCRPFVGGAGQDDEQGQVEAGKKLPGQPPASWGRIPWP